jgi:hypothetical protein
VYNKISNAKEKLIGALSVFNGKAMTYAEKNIE